MKLILGLGNIGSQYARTRHNIGFMVVDQLAEQLQATWRTETKFKAAITEATLESGERLILAKPHTMMNLSGEAAQRLMQFYKIQPAGVWAVFDELDIPFGRLRIRTGGSGGGHQGVNSLIRHIGANFIRVRVGISLNDRTKESSEVYVLKPFNPDEQARLPELITSASNILQTEIKREAPEDTTFSLLQPGPDH